MIGPVTVLPQRCISIQNCYKPDEMLIHKFVPKTRYLTMILCFPNAFRNYHDLARCHNQRQIKQNHNNEIKTLARPCLFNKCKTLAHLMEETGSRLAIDKQSMYDRQILHSEYSLFDAKIHEKSISETEKSTFH